MLPQDLDLDLLRCFLVVAENGGFTAAAKRLHLSQSAVSLKIQRLESLLGSCVFERTSRSLSMTTEGELLLGYARRLLALGEEMLREISQPAVEGTLRIGVVQQFGQQFLPQVLSRFRKAYPRVFLSVEVGMSADLLGAIEEDRFDLVMAGSGYGSRSTAKGNGFREERVIFREPMVWTRASGSMLDLRVRTPLPLVLFPPPCGFRRIALDLLEQDGRAWRAVYASASMASIQAAVQADLGIAALGRSAVVAGMEIVGRKEGLPDLPETAVSLYHRKSAAEDLVKSLGDFISDAIDSWKAGLPRGRRGKVETTGGGSLAGP